MTTSVPVALGDRSYDIHIGAGVLNECGERIAATVRTMPAKLPVVTDENVSRLHYAALAESLGAAGFNPEPIVLPPGEHTKSFAYLEQLLNKLLDLEIERSGLIVAFGGGVIGDLAGFAAGILKRGVAFAQIPTTLLAQVDSSVGGKTAIDSRQGKNLIGVFHQPRIVIADTDVLSTLPKRELLSGYAEVAKYGLLGDAAFFDWLERNASDALAGDKSALTHAVAHSCKMKADIVARDERENGERALLNLGHTFGHALEAHLEYENLLTHGEAVALGCVLAFRLSSMLGFCRVEEALRVERHFANMGFMTALADLGEARPAPADLIRHIRQDKKNQGGQMTFVLVEKIGKAFVTADVPEEAVIRLLSEE
jgi:3-dehydroquinate synthase